MSVDFFPSFQPNCHLRILVSVICRPVRILCQVDVESFCILGVVVISCPKHFDGVDIVSEGVEFGEVKIVSDTKVNKDVLVLVKPLERLIQKLKGFGGVDGILGKVEEVEKRADRSNQGNWGGAIRELEVNNKSEKDATHVSVLLSSDPRKGGDPFRESADAVIGREALATGVDVFLTEGCCNPGYEMLQHALIKLMENVGSDSNIYV